MMKKTNRLLCVGRAKFPLQGVAVLTMFLSLTFVFEVPRAFASSQTAPTIRLFPTTVVENVKQTGETARAMEEGLQGIVQELEQQMILYKESKCEGAEADEGCADIMRQMGDKYLEMLNRMEDQLPEMERSLKVTGVSLERHLRQELGKKMTPRGLQRMIAGNDRKAAEKRPGNRQGRLSEKFRKYYKLVALGSRSGGNGSLAAVASDIYLDTQEVLELVTLTRDEIGRAKLMIQLNQEYGSVTPEMFKMVSGVKGVIFGEVESELGIPGSPDDAVKAQYRSPLEM